MMGLPLARLPAERHIDDGEQDGVQIGGNGYSHRSGRPDRPHYDRRNHDHREDTCDHGSWVKAQHELAAVERRQDEQQDDDGQSDRGEREQRRAKVHECRWLRTDHLKGGLSMLSKAVRAAPRTVTTRSPRRSLSAARLIEWRSTLKRRLDLAITA